MTPLPFVAVTLNEGSVWYYQGAKQLTLYQIFENVSAAPNREALIYRVGGGHRKRLGDRDNGPAQGVTEAGRKGRATEGRRTCGNEYSACAAR